MKLSAVVITRNEEERIDACLGSVAFADEIVMVDSGSSDKTVERAKACRARVFVRDFDDFASQKNFALSQAKGEWILAVDADEQVTEGLRESVRRVVGSGAAENGFRVRRRNVHFGQRFSFAGTGQDFPVRLFRKKRASYQGKIHEVVKIDGHVGALEGELLHMSFQNMRDYMKRLKLYTGLEALREDAPDVSGSNHMLLRSIARFLSLFLWKQGFREGEMGLRYCLLSSWYELVRLAKAWERKQRV